MGTDTSAPAPAAMDGVPVRMPDGAELRTDVHLPAGDGPWPVVLVRTPYGRMFQGEEAPKLTGRGIAFVVQDVRGRFGSAGDFDLGSSDAADGAATVAWLREQPWCDGRVAGRGTSYPGITQWRTALERPEGLVTVAPMMCPPWWGRLGFREGGAVQLALAAHWLPGQAAWDERLPQDVRDACVAGALAFEDVLTDGVVDLEKALAHPALSRMPLSDPGPMSAEPYASLWRRIFEPPREVSFLLSDGPSGEDRVDCPVLVVGSWYDVGWSRGQTEAYRHLRRTSRPELARDHRLVMSGHGHGFHMVEGVDLGPDSYRFHLDTDIAWAAEWLLDDAAGELRSLAPVTYFTIGPNVWRSADDWPPPEGRAVRLYVHPDDRALAGRPVERAAAARFDFDPAWPVPTRGGAGLGLPPGPRDQAGITGGARDDVLSFDGEPLPQTVEIAGPVCVDLFASSDAPDTDFTAKLVDVAPDGRALSICDGVLRARYRNGPVPQPLRPGTVERFRIDLGCVAYALPAGHRLRLDVSSSNFPKVDRNPNTGAPEGSDTTMRVARQTVVASQAHPTAVDLWVTVGASCLT